MTDIKLRPYQQRFIADVRSEFRSGFKRVVGVAPCGAGKTIMTGWMIRESLNRGKRSIFFVHRHELIEQTSKTFTNLDIPHGIIAAGVPMNLNLPVQIAAVQTLARRIDTIPTPDFLICDECHHILADTYKKVLDAFPHAFLLGVTATPQRMGGITLCDVFQSMVESLSVTQLIKLGNLTHFNYFAPQVAVDLNNVRVEFGDFNNDDLARVMSQKKIIGGIVDNYLKFANDKSAICYCVNVKHSKTVADAFNKAGIRAAHVDGDTSKSLRSQIVNDFRNGNIKVLCNAELFGEGFDVPHCQAVILARPTKSLTLHVQQSMRAMRPDPNDLNKVAVIIDHVQNYLRHGLPTDVHNWSLEPNEREESKLKPRLCPQCNNVVSHNVRTCPHCGYQFPREERGGIIDFQHGELVNITQSYSKTDLHNTFSGDVENLNSAHSNLGNRISHAFTKPEEFLSVATARNYKIGWVAFQSLKFAKSYDDCLHIADICHYDKGWAWHQWHNLINKKGA